MIVSCAQRRPDVVYPDYVQGDSAYSSVRNLSDQKTVANLGKNEKVVIDYYSSGCFHNDEYRITIGGKSPKAAYEFHPQTSELKRKIAAAKRLRKATTNQTARDVWATWIMDWAREWDALNEGRLEEAKALFYENNRRTISATSRDFLRKG